MRTIATGFVSLILLFGIFAPITPASAGPISSTDCSRATMYAWHANSGQTRSFNMQASTRRFTNPAGTCQLERKATRYTSTTGTNWTFESSTTKSDPTTAWTSDGKNCGLSWFCKKWKVIHYEKVSVSWYGWHNTYAG